MEAEMATSNGSSSGAEGSRTVIDFTDLPNLSSWAQEILTAVCVVARTSLADLRGMYRSEHLIEARSVAYILLHEQCGLYDYEIAHIFSSRTGRNIHLRRLKLRLAWRENPDSSQSQLFKTVCEMLKLVANEVAKRDSKINKHHR
jgi:hypothetical protein